MKIAFVEPKAPFVNFYSWAIKFIPLMGPIYLGTILKNEGHDVTIHNENFKEIDPDLLHYTEISQIPLDFTHTTGITIGNEDNIYVTGDNSVLILSNEGKTQSTFPVNEKAYCIAADESGLLYLGMMETS